MFQSCPLEVPLSMSAACLGGWISVVRRLDGSEDFYRGWADYKSGFGDPDREFWLGLNTIHALTSARSYSLRVEMTNMADTFYWAEYSSFSVGDESSKYVLSVSGLTPCHQQEIP